jgi:3-oxoacyl-[acyl-carrier protein] reductase
MITGAGQGIGAATARRLADDGATVAVLDLSLEQASRTAGSIVDAGGRAWPIVCDVTDRAAVESAVDEVLDLHGRLDILVNNAGITRDNLLFKMSDADFDAVVGVHLRGTFLCCRAAQVPMVSAGHGRIVNISSRSALGNPGQANYAAAKAGIQGLTATVAAELGRYAITVNAVAPGYVATEMTAATARRLGVDPAEHQDRAARTIPLRRVAQPEEIAAAVSFFAGPDSSYVTGQTLLVSGGAR